MTQIRRSIIPSNEFSQHRNRMLIRGLLIGLFLLVSFSLICALVFINTLNDRNFQFNDLSLYAQIQLFQEVFTPGTIIFLLALTTAIYIFAWNTVQRFNRSHYMEGSQKVKSIHIDSQEQHQNVFGPASLQNGLKYAAILKDFSGLLRIILPQAPAPKDAHFLANTQKIQELLSMQPSLLETSVVVKTKEGVSITFPNVSLRYGFQIAVPDKNKKLDGQQRTAEKRKIAKYVLWKGDFNLDDLLSVSVSDVIQRRVRTLSLDQLSKQPSSTSGWQPSEKWLHHLRQYKINAFKKHHLLKTKKDSRSLQWRKTQNLSRVKRKHTRRQRLNPSGNTLCSQKLIDHTPSQGAFISVLQQLVFDDLNKKLSRYHLSVLSIDLNGWQAGSLQIKKKFTAVSSQKEAIISARRSFDARQVQMNAKQQRLLEMQMNSERMKNILTQSPSSNYLKIIWLNDQMKKGLIISESSSRHEDPISGNQEINRTT